MGELKKFIVVTEEIITCATNVKQETRDQDIAKINELLDQREDILAKIIPPFSKDELNLCEQLPSMNKRLEDAMTALQAMIQKDLLFEQDEYGDYSVGDSSNATVYVPTENDTLKIMEFDE